MAPYEALYGRPCRSPTCWTEVGEKKLLGPDIVQIHVEKVKMIKEKMKAAQSRQKSYADQRRHEQIFAIGDYVLLKVSPTKGVMRFSRKGKLSPRYIGPFEILDEVGEGAYKLALPPSYDRIHNVFHVSMLRKYKHDDSHVPTIEEPNLKEDLTYEEYPIEILEYRDHRLRNKIIPMVKVSWQHHYGLEATWELEEEMRTQFPYLFG